MRERFITTFQMAKEDWCLLMDRSMKATLKMANLMVKACSSIMTNADTTGIGLMISSMAMVKRLGLMARNTKECTKTAKNVEKENFTGTMELFMKENLRRIISMAMELLNGLMDPHIKGTGWTIKRRVKAYSLGQMVATTMDAI